MFANPNEIPPNIRAMIEKMTGKSPEAVMGGDSTCSRNGLTPRDVSMLTRGWTIMTEGAEHAKSCECKTCGIMHPFYRVSALILGEILQSYHMGRDPRLGGVVTAVENALKSNNGG